MFGHTLLSTRVSHGLQAIPVVKQIVYTCVCVCMCEQVTSTVASRKWIHLFVAVNKGHTRSECWRLGVVSSSRAELD